MTENAAGFRKGARLGPGRQVAANLLQARRIERDLTQEELGVRIGRSGRYIGLVENGEHIPPEAVVEALAQALGISPNTVRGWLGMPRRRRRFRRLPPQPPQTPRADVAQES